METLLETTGQTPLFKLSRGVPDGGAAIYAKVERFNPSVSIKDRTVGAIIEEAERAGILQPGATIIEPVAGNTGIALAHICNVHGYRLILTMPEDYMPEHRHILECCGTRIETTPAAAGMTGAIERAHQLLEENPEAFMPNHFSNRVQVEAHRQGLVKEIVEDLDGATIDAFIGCIGTGSSLTAIAEEFRPNGTQIIAVEPEGCALLAKGETGRHAIPGISFGFVPDYLPREAIDRVEVVTEEDVLQGFKELATQTGLLAGLSSGANFFVAKRVSQELGDGKNILTIFYDGGERYFSLKEELQRENEI